jgi:PAS domain S-box-containing protein
MSVTGQKRVPRKNSDESLSAFSALNRFSAALISFRDSDQVLTHAVRQIRKIFRAKSCGIFLLDDKGVLELKKGLGFSRVFRKGFHSRVSPKLTREILKRIYPGISNDTLVGHRKSKSFRDLLKRDNIHKEIGVPLKVKNKLKGILHVGRGSSYADFSQTDLTLLDLLSTQTAAAVFNAKVNQQLEERYKVQQNLIEGAPDPVVVLDLKGNITYCNKAAQVLTRYAKAELIGMHVSRLGSMDKKEISRSLKLFKAIRGGKKASPFEVQAKDKEGTPRWLEAHLSRITTKGQTTGFRITARDITERQKTEIALSRKEQIATERARLLNDLRGVNQIDEILTRVCEAVRDSGLFERAVMTLHKRGGQIIYLGQVGLPSRVVKRARHAPPIDDKLRSRITDRKFRVSDSFFVPHEAGLNYSKTARHIPQKKRSSGGGDWQPGDELFVPLRDSSEEIMGYLSVDSPTNGCRPDLKTIHALETFVEAGAARVREVEARDALKRERDISRSILEAANSLIVCLDADARITAFNQECERVTGYRREEVLGKRWPELFLPPAYRHAQLKSFAKWVRAHPRDLYEGPIVTKNDEIRTILWSNTSISGSDKKELLAIAIGQDITERKHAEQALRKSEEMFRTMVETAPGFLVIYDLKGKNVYISPNCEKITGYTQEELMKGTIWWTHEDDTKRSKEALKSSIRTGVGVRDFEYKLMKKNGDIIYASSSWEPIRDERGRITHVLVQTADVTERKRAEEAVDKERQRLFSAFEILPAFVYVQAPDYSIPFVNRKFRELFGDPGKRRCYEVFHGRREPCEECRTLRVLETGVPQAYEWTSRDGRDYMICEDIFPAADGKEMVLEFGIDITDRKRAEQALRISRERYQLSTRAANVGVWDWNVETNEFYVDPNVKEILGYKDEEIPNDIDVWMTKVHPDDREPVMAAAQACLDGKTREYVIEHRMLHKNGCIRWILSRGNVIRDEKGNAVRMVGTDTDITERRRAQEELKAGENKYRTLLENLPQKIFLKDRNSVYLSCNENFARDLGIKAEEIAGKTDYDYFPKELADKYTADDKRIVKSGKTEDIEERYIQGGQEVFVHTVKTPVKDERGNLIGLLGIFWDITEGRRAQQALRESEERYRVLFEGSAEGILIADAETKRFKYANPALSKILGYSTEEFSAMGVPDIHPKEELGKLISEFEVRAKEERTLAPNIPCVRKDGKIIYADINTARALIDGRQCNIGLFRDVTERKLAEEALRQSEERFRGIFENSPISLWEEDFSRIKRFIDGLRAKGVKDFRKYFERHPEAVPKCEAMVKVLDVNQASLELFKAEHKEELQGGLARTFSDESYQAFGEELIAIARGGSTFETEAITKTLKGDRKHVVLRWSVAPGYERTLSKVLVSVSDITELKRAREKNLLLETSKAVSRTLKLDQVLKVATEKMAQALKADRCAIALFGKGDDSTAIRYAFVKGDSPSPTLPREWTPVNKDFSREREILLKKGHLHIKNAETDALPTPIKSYFRKAGIKSSLIIPLIVDQKLF